MKNISGKVLRDYLFYSFGLFLFVVLLEPFGTRNFLASNPTPYFYYFIEAVSFFVIFVICELLTTYVFHLPADYSESREYQVKRLLSLALPCILLNALFDGQYFCILQWGIDRWHYQWTDFDGSLTMKWFMRDLKEAICVGAFVVAFHGFVTWNRMQKYQIDELQSINQMLGDEQKMLRSHISKDNVADEIVIHGDSRESLTVNPLDIMYIESVGNYLNIVYFSNSDLCQKRLRSSLKDIEETLEAFPFIIHTHRAFLVNINFITQVSGNSAGYKISLFSTDRVLPVSKANVGLFRDKIKELGKDLK